MPDASPRPSDIGPDGLPAIFWAIKNYDAQTVRRYLDAGGDIEVKGFAGATPALSAAVGDVWSICLLLLQRGADPKVFDKRGFTIAWLASRADIDPTSEEGRALAAVRTILERRGATEIVEPSRLRSR